MRCIALNTVQKGGMAARIERVKSQMTSSKKIIHKHHFIPNPFYLHFENTLVICPAESVAISISDVIYLTFHFLCT